MGDDCLVGGKPLYDAEHKDGDWYAQTFTWKELESFANRTLPKFPIRALVHLHEDNVKTQDEEKTSQEEEKSQEPHTKRSDNGDEIWNLDNGDVITKFGKPRDW